jgi:hypothetical protein
MNNYNCLQKIKKDDIIYIHSDIRVIPLIKIIYNNEIELFVDCEENKHKINFNGEAMVLSIFNYFKHKSHKLIYQNKFDYNKTYPWIYFPNINSIYKIEKKLFL